MKNLIPAHQNPDRGDTETEEQIFIIIIYNLEEDIA